MEYWHARRRPPLPPHVLRALREAAPRRAAGDSPPAEPANNKPTKFRSRVAVDTDGVVYESQLERQTAFDLEQLRRAGALRKWTWAPRFLLEQDPLKPNTLITYRPDFMVWPVEGPWFVIDAKGVRTATFNLKVRLWKLRYPDHQLMLAKKNQPWQAA